MTHRKHLLAFWGALILATAAVAGAADKPESITPQPRLKAYEWMSIERWQRMHAEDRAIAREAEVDLLFIGDSITEGWPEPLWREYFGDYRAANFGIGGDKTENLLWRLDHGAAGQLDPKVVSLLIGVNNFGLSDHSARDVILGVEAVVEKLRDKFPRAKILLHSIFPYKESPRDPARERLAQVNSKIAQLAEREQVYLLDMGDHLVDKDGHISPEIMPDYLHLSERGYRLWAENLDPILSRWLSESD